MALNEHHDPLPRRLLALLPKSTLLYRACNRYVDIFKGQNNGNLFTNGELKWMRTVLPRCRICFDVGANVGEWATLALQVAPSVQIHCFEPSQATFRKLQERPLVGSVVRNNFGLSSVSENRQLWVFEDGAGTNSLYRRQGLEDSTGLAEQHRAEVVQLDTLESYCARADIATIDLLKVDVEGHELDVFKGGKALFAAGQIKRIQFEYGGCNIDSRVLLRDLFEFLAPWGYNFSKLYPHGPVAVPRYDQQLENFQYQNWVATAPGVPM